MKESIHHADSERWEIARAWTGPEFNTPALERLLSQGFEPFAVQATGREGYTYHLRRQLDFDGDVSP